MARGSGFGAEYLFRGDDFSQGKLVQGDVLQICYMSQGSVREGDQMRLSIIPGTGTTSEIDAWAPSIIALQRTVVYPKADTP